jgi:O-antigen ligase
MQNFLYLLLAYLPFQIALNPAEGFDLASIRVIVPLFFLTWLALGLKKKQLAFPVSSVSGFLLTFLFLAAFSILFAQNINWSLRKLAFIFSLAPLFFVIPTYLDSQQKTKTALKFLVYGAAAMAVVAIFQFLLQFAIGLDGAQTIWSKYLIAPFLGNTFSQAVISYPSWLVNISGKTYLRAFGLFPDPHMLAFYLGMSLPWAAALYFESRKKTFLVASFIIFIADLLTFSRGGYLGLFGGFIISLLFIKKIKIKHLLIAASALILTAMMLLLSPIGGRLISTFDVSEGSNLGRIAIWKQTLDIICNNPLGVGIGNYSLVVNPIANYRDPIYAHSLYLDIASELGIISLLVWLMLIAGAAYGFYKKGLHDNLYLAGIISLSIYSFHSLVENALFSIQVFTLLMIILAISTCLDKTSIKQSC